MIRSEHVRRKRVRSAAAFVSVAPALVGIAPGVAAQPGASAELSAAEGAGSVAETFGPFPVKKHHKYRVTYEVQKPGGPAFDAHYSERAPGGESLRKQRWMLRDHDAAEEWRRHHFTFNALGSGEVVLRLRFSGPGECHVHGVTCEPTGDVAPDAAVDPERRPLLKSPGFERREGGAVYPNGRHGQHWMGVPSRPGPAISVDNPAAAPQGERYVHLTGTSGVHQPLQGWRRDRAYRFSVVARRDEDAEASMLIYISMGTVRDGERDFMFSHTFASELTPTWTRYELYFTADDDRIEHLTARFDTSGRVYLDDAGFTAVPYGAIPPSGTAKRALGLDTADPGTVAPRGAPAAVHLLRGLYHERWGLDAALDGLGAVRGYEFVAGEPSDALRPRLSLSPLEGARLIVVADVNDTAMGRPRRIAEFVESGGSLLYLGGLYSYSKGVESPAIREMLPVRLASSAFAMTGDQRKTIEPGEAWPGGAAAPGASALREAGMRIRYVHRVAGVRDGAAVWLRAGGAPLLVTRRYGKGRVVAFTGTVLGDYGGAEPFWESDAWSGVLRATVGWLVNER